MGPGHFVTVLTARRRLPCQGREVLRDGDGDEQQLLRSGLYGPLVTVLAHKYNGKAPFPEAGTAGPDLSVQMKTLNPGESDCHHTLPVK